MSHQTHGRVSRRTVMQSGAWGVPVIALATAAPLASASQPAPNFGVEVTPGCYSLTGDFYPEIRFEAVGPDPIPAGTRLEGFTGDNSLFAVAIETPAGEFTFVGSGNGLGTVYLPVDIEVGSSVVVVFQPVTFTCDLRATLYAPTPTDPDFVYEETVCSDRCGPI